MRADKLFVCGDSSLKLWMIVVVSLPCGSRAEAKIVTVFGVKVVDGDHAVSAIEVKMEVPFAGEFPGHFQPDMSIFFDFEFTCPVPIVVTGGVFGGFSDPDEDQVIVNCGEIFSAGERGLIFTVVEGELFAPGEQEGAEGE